MRAYNDWHIDEWCAAPPGRFIPMALPAIWDAELCAQEIRRVAEKGCHALTFPENPVPLGYPSFHSEYWDPVWRALTDCGTVMNLHIGSSGRLAITAPDAPPDVMITLQPINLVQAAADLMWSRVLKEYPAIRIALSEGGTGWIPYFLDRLDRTYEMHATWTLQDFGGRRPSEIFREHFLTCFISDPIGVKLCHDIGIDNICWEADYPHSDSMWPNAPEEPHEVLIANSVPDDDINKMTHENAMRWYSFDPFAHVPREQVAGAEFGHGAVGVGLDGDGGDEEAFGDLVVGQAGAHQCQHFPFPGGQGGQSRGVDEVAGGGVGEDAGDETLGGRWGEQRLASGHQADGVEQLRRFDPLAQEAARAGPQGLDDQVVLLEGGQDEDLHPGQVLVLGDQPGRLDTVDFGHPDVHDHDIGALGPGQSRRLPPVGGLSDDLHVRLGADEQPEGAAEQGLVVGEKDANGHEWPFLTGRQTGWGRARGAVRRRPGSRPPAGVRR